MLPKQKLWKTGRCCCSRDRVASAGSAEEWSGGLKEKTGREATRRNIRRAMSHEAMEGILFLTAYIVVKREVVSRNAEGCSLTRGCQVRER